MKYANNPFNIRTSGTFWKGQSGFRNGFCEFESLEFGIRAALILMRTYRRKGFDTPRKIINRFAPPSENNTLSYLGFVCYHADLNKDEVLEFDWKYYDLLYFMALMESHTELNLTDIISIAQKYHIKIVPNKI